MEFKKIERDPELMELTRKIIDQNDVILKMNAQLLTLLSMPVMVVAGDSRGMGNV